MKRTGMRLKRCYRFWFKGELADAIRNLNKSSTCMHKKEIITGGKKLENAKKVLILLHGRGAPAQDILGLATHLNVSDFALIAPQATNYSWYPYSFLVPPEQNEPWLTSALGLIDDVVADIVKAGIVERQIYFTGFSQGACLTLEYIARHAKRWGGVAAFTGGLIGDKLYPRNYSGDFDGTPVFIGTSDPDPHIPVQRVHETTKQLRDMQAKVTQEIYPDIGHTITEEEIRKVNALIFKN
jgi:phospholipase/carboxylesterase